MGLLKLGGYGTRFIISNAALRQHLYMYKYLGLDDFGVQILDPPTHPWVRLSLTSPPPRHLLLLPGHYAGIPSAAVPRGLRVFR